MKEFRPVTLTEKYGIGRQVVDDRSLQQHIQIAGRQRLEDWVASDPPAIRSFHRPASFMKYSSVQLSEFNSRLSKNNS
ncbi:hypothetical protein SAE02_18130 [Skermanella aerolata]|uniref:Uncharacterized protein n=1 Tax=Skermanella aerolata TaxID=393310 RepID=A0A512DMG1_9PROT|nr:hypothetical protein SAE02_18130 [Skermanella aerolata]